MNVWLAYLSDQSSAVTAVWNVGRLHHSAANILWLGAESIGYEMQSHTA